MHGQLMSGSLRVYILPPKVAVSFDGRISWFAVEEAIDDWLYITTLAPDKWAPSLKAILVGDASIYKPLLDRERLRDPNDGVDYFKHELRPHFVKGVEAVFIFRLYQLQRFYRGSQYLQRWNGILQVLHHWRLYGYLSPRSTRKTRFPASSAS